MRMLAGGIRSERRGQLNWQYLQPGFDSATACMMRNMRGGATCRGLQAGAGQVLSDNSKDANRYSPYLVLPLRYRNGGAGWCTGMEPEPPRAKPGYTGI